ncbi:MAG: response regulator, partial [Victivallales bacterium]|nr:response regulator [Victivallales bacterium]
ANREWYTKAMTYSGRSVIVSPYNTFTDGKTIITVSKALGDERKTVVGVDIAIEALQPLVDEINIKEMRDCMIVAPNGYTMCRNENDDEKSIMRLNSRKISERAISHSGSFFMDFDSGKVLFLSVPIHAGWRVVVATRQGMLSQKDFRRRMLCMFMTVGFSIIALTFICMVLYRFHADTNSMIETEAVSRAKSTFLLNMSHDIRTPMNAIIGFTNLALEHVENTEKVKEYLTKTAVANEHMLSLLNDILDMSRIESGNIQLEEDPCDMKSLVADCEVVMRSQAEAKNQTFSIELHNVEDTPVICDRLRLQQVIVNLTRNAIKFTQKGGEVKLIVRELNSWNGKVDFEIDVQDNGPGISPELQQEIFKPLASNFGAGTLKPQGVGLGLAITKNIVTLMGGRITLVSELGQGTTFTVRLTLRLAKPANNKHDAAKSDSSDNSSKCILLVEDNEINRDIAMELLKNMGYKFEIAGNGKEAVDKIGDSPSGTYSLILMDVQMPIMDGYEATRKIRSLGKGDSKTIPIIAMTANAFDEDRAEAIAAGMNEHLTKPVQPKLLAETLKKYL